MRIGQTSLVVFLSKLLGSALGFLATIYFARELGAEVLGYYFLVVAIVAWLKLGGHLGVAQAVNKRISEGEDRSAFFSAGLAIILALGLLLSIGIVALRGPLETYIGTEVSLFVVVMLLAALFAAIVQAALQGERLVHIAGILDPINIGVRSIIQITLVVVGFGLAGMLIGWAVGAAIVGLLGLTFLSVGLKWPRRQHIESLVDYAKFSWLGSLESRAYNDVDVLVLGALVPSALVGVYAVAWSLAGFLSLFGNAVSSTLFPEMSRADATGSDTTVASYVNDGLTFAGLFIIPGFFGGTILADRILRIYGPEFTQGSTVFSLLVLAVLFYTYQRQLINSLNAIDRPDISFRIHAIFILVNVVLNVVLVLYIGFVGAAIATAASTGFGLVLTYFELRKFIEFEVPVGEIGRQFVAAVLMGIVVLGGHVMFEMTEVVDHNAGITFILVTVGGCLYFVTLLVLSNRFRATVVSNSPIELPIGSR